ncbi:response regulator [Pedobacter petrophilus]|uniref:histidine kinase n=1 Tax=Pedobacter petrophilus TaxID=1908241 RepID=A0A7K0FT34_9SPHI|nr:ATP-binding protein [Pedobacter petrophilus]MRX74777.1 response regulator [Pedobacter petrophilus]
MKPVKSSARKYLVVVSSILAIFGITAVLFVNFSNIPLLKSVKKSTQVQYGCVKFDSCIFKLYNAENSCRMYILSEDRSYYDLFVKEIAEISLTMESLNNKNNKENALVSKDFDRLIAQKKLQTQQFIFLKRLSDSLINFSVQVSEVVKGNSPQARLFTTKQFKNIIDTIKPKIAADQKKHFFCRVIAAINGRTKNETNSAKSILAETAIADTSSLNLIDNNRQLTALNNYYLKLFLTNNKLKNKEKQLLNINHLLILAIVDRLKKYKSTERDYHSSAHQIADMTVLDEIENLDKFTRVLLALAIGLLAFVFYMIYHFYKNEKALIAHSDKAAYYAISKSRFLANMSHEIRTPLNSIVGFSEQLAQINLGEKQREQVSAIERSSLMLLEVVNNILDFSKYETGKVILEQVSFSPYAAIKDVFDSMSVQATIKKIGFKMDLNINDDIYILGDPLRLKQVVMNLLSNAIKFTLNGTVTLHADLTIVQEGQAKLNVNITDTGMGINPIDQLIIFEEFTQVYYPSTKERQQGTGLGLAICKKIVEFQGGTIGVKSREGEGSVFSFELSYRTTVKPILIESSTSKLYHSAASLTGKRILLVDDNMLNILLASTILKKYKISFDAVYNGKEAYGYFKENEYDLILTDIQMPEMGGIELTQKIRKNHDIKKKNTPILGVTANILWEDRLKYLASGMDELVLKPFLEHELVEKILKFIR